MRKPKLGTRFLTTAAIIGVAVVAAGFLYVRFIQRPWTRDGQVSANIVMVAPRVTGVIVSVGVIDNQFVNKGDLLFEIDPDDYELAVASAQVQLEESRQQVAALEAAVVAAEAGVSEADTGVTTARAKTDAAQAQVGSAEASVSAARAGLQVAQASIDKSTAALAESIRDRDRAQRLAEDGAGSVANAESRAASVLKAQATLAGSRASALQAQAGVDQAQSALLQSQADLTSAQAGVDEADARLASALAGLTQARANLGTPGEENVMIRAAKVDLASAELDLQRTSVRAPADGYAINVTVNPGDYATPGAPILAFVDSTSFYVQGFFRETQLRHINVGDRVVVTLMSHRNEPIEGVVESIGWAINPPDIATTGGTSGLVPQVEPSFDWIRLAQRVPVHVRIETVPEGVRLISGTTASVVVEN